MRPKLRGSSLRFTMEGGGFGYHTQTRGEEHHIQVCDKLLGIGVKEALLGDDVAG